MARRMRKNSKHEYSRKFIYLIELRYRNAETGWQWRTRKFRKCRPSPINVRPPKYVSSDMKRAHESWLRTQFYIAETLQQTVGEYLHH